MKNLVDKRRSMIDAITKEAVYNATISVLEEHGLQGMTMELVAKTAGMAKGTLYNYFKNKLDLLLYVTRTTFEPVMEKLRVISESDLNPPEKFREITRMIFHLFEEKKRVWLLISGSDIERQSEEEHRKTNRQHGINYITKVIQEGIDQGYFRKLDPVAAAQMFIGSVRGVIRDKIDLDINRSAEEDVANLLELFTNGIFLKRESNN